MKRYIVTVSRTIAQFQDFEVEADTTEEAEADAVALAVSESIGWDDCDGTGDDFQANEVEEVEVTQKG